MAHVATADPTHQQGNGAARKSAFSLGGPAPIAAEVLATMYDGGVRFSAVPAGHFRMGPSSICGNCLVRSFAENRVLFEQALAISGRALVCEN